MMSLGRLRRLESIFVFVYGVERLLVVPLHKKR